MKIKQSRDELLNHLKEQINFIKKSNAEFDAGDLSEAKRIATHLRVLLHDTKQSKSLLSNLDFKSGLKFLNSASPYNSKNLMPYIGLVFIRSTSDGKNFITKYEPFLDAHQELGKNTYIPFKEWWEMTVVVDSNKHYFKRKEIILNIADTDGGAHVDESLRDEYVQLSRNNSVNWYSIVGKSDGKNVITPVENIHFSTLRQISFEVIQSLNHIKV